jgi:hypothetical protein
LLAQYEGESTSIDAFVKFTRVPVVVCRFLPYVGYVTIAMVCILLISVLSAPGTDNLHAQNDFPQLKYALLGGMGLLALIQRE